MSITTRNPVRMTGGTINSGFPSTGEVPMTRGGQATATVFSGAIAMGVAAAGAGALSSGGSVLVVSGAGRLNNFTAVWPAGVALAGNGENACISGQPIVVYDSAITARSGVLTDSTIAESGRKILFTWCPPKQLASGVTNESFAARYLPIPLDVPFFSGLCVMALSGAPGFNLNYTPETA
jgi:hypothetical protein